MRMRVVWGSFFLALALFPGACSKSSESANLPPMEVEGVKVDIPQLSAEFVKAQPDLQSQVNEAVTKVRYRRYVQAMMGLDEVLKNPGLNDKQKQLLTKVMDQLKEVSSKTPDQGNQ